jgi:hypothetical protein
MKLYHHLLSRLLILLLLIFAVEGCKGNVQGYVFLDENANTKKEDTENKISNLTIKVTKDDEEIATSQTDSLGNFSVPASGAGTYCVTVSDASLSATNDDGTSASIAALKRSSAQPSALQTAASQAGSPLFASSLTESSCTDGLDNDADGDIDCADSDCTTNTTCLESGNCSDKLDNDIDGLTDCDDSDCTSDSACTSTGTTTGTTTSAATVSSGSACDDSKGGNLTLKVPITKDYSSGIAALEDPGTTTVSRGDTVSLSIQYPSSCEFDTGLYLSLSLTPMNVPAAAYDSTTGQLNLNSVVDSAASTDLSVSEPLSVGDDGISTYSLDLCIGDFDGTTCVSDGGLDSKTVTIAPTATCPDDTSVTLKSHSIAIDSADDITVTQSMSGTQDAGATITVTTTVTNRTSVDYTSSEVSLALSTPDFTTSQSYDSSCSNLGQSAKCVFDIPASSSVILTTTFILPVTLSSNTTETMGAVLTLTSNGDSATFTGDTVTFSMPCNATTCT